MTAALTLDVLLAAALFAALGIALGAIHFASLRHSVEAYLGGAVVRGVGLHLGRLALAGGAFVLIAKHGGLPLLAALAGFLLARWCVLRTARVR